MNGDFILWALMGLLFFLIAALVVGVIMVMIKIHKNL